MPGTEEHTYKPGTWEAEADISLWAWGHLDPHSEFQACQDYIVRKLSQQNKKPQQRILTVKGWRCSSKVKHMLGKHEALGSIAQYPLNFISQYIYVQ